jgi:hypothetical protein
MGVWSASRSGRALAPGKGPPVSIVQEAGWAPRAGLDIEDRGNIILSLPGIEPRSPGRPARSQTLTELPGSQAGSRINQYFNLTNLFCY